MNETSLTTISLVDIAYTLPSGITTNVDLSGENPAWDMDRVASKTGVVSRHIAAEDETALDLAYSACQVLLERNPGLAEIVDGIVFCTQTADFVMPPNSCLLHKSLGLRDGVFALDITLACSGFVYGLALVRGLIATGVCKNVLLVTADTYSKLISDGDRSVRSLFGDAAAVTWLRGSRQAGLIDVICETSGSGYEKFYVPAGGMRNRCVPSEPNSYPVSSGDFRSEHQIHMDGLGVLSFAVSKVPQQVRVLMDRNLTSVEDLDLVVFHQASKLALDSLQRNLGFPPGLVYSNIKNVGNTVSASIPIALAQAKEQGAISPGALILVSGFGVGLSWASALLRV